MTYRSEKAVQEQKIGQLLQENEAIEKEMAELSKLEEEVRRELGEGAVQPSPFPGSTAVSILDKADLRRLK